jgi:hypothetical protein
LGTRLLALAKRASTNVHLWTFQCNFIACALYEKQGFRRERETDGAGNEEKQPDALYVWENPSAGPGRSNPRLDVNGRHGAG